jgi:putative endonuclease
LFTRASKSQAGRAGEERAAEFLLQNGFHILARNYRSPAGEVDLVAEDHGALVFVEVKSWSYFSFEDLEYSVNKRKQNRIIETAKHFITNERKYKWMAVRFDVVFVSDNGFKLVTSAFGE